MYTSTDCIENGWETGAEPLNLQYFWYQVRKERISVGYNMKTNGRFQGFVN